MTYSDIVWRSLQNEARSVKAPTFWGLRASAYSGHSTQRPCKSSVWLSATYEILTYFVGRISLRRPCSGSEVENTMWGTNWLRCRTRFRKRSRTRGLWETWCPHVASWRYSSSRWVSWLSNNWVESIPSSSIREKYLRAQAVPYPPPLPL